jgi:hypothetical protein
MAAIENEWMTREEAARHLKISVRSLDRQCLPQNRLGRSVRYHRPTLDAYLLESMMQPVGRPQPHVRVVSSLRLSSAPRRNRSGGDDWLRKQMERIPA